MILSASTEWTLKSSPFSSSWNHRSSRVSVMVFAEEAERPLLLELERRMLLLERLLLERLLELLPLE